MMGDWGDANRGQSPGAVWAPPRIAAQPITRVPIRARRITLRVGVAITRVAPTRIAALVPVIARPIPVAWVREAVGTIARALV